ncbi:MAG: hypothetical protein CMJ58_16500 [Planctomycetaceae bacterium]|nr:hypothetical protein [Planctomycetaceae bacterium]
MKPEIVNLLNRLLAILCKSFPQYLRWSRPFVPAGRGEVMEAIGSIADDQDRLADRVSRMIDEAGYPPRDGEFPMEFTDMHDLGIDFLINAAVAYQEQDVETISKLVDRLQTAPAGKAIAEEALGMAKGHLDTLRELVAAPAAQ